MVCEAMVSSGVVATGTYILLLTDSLRGWLLAIACRCRAILLRRTVCHSVDRDFANTVLRL